jgi:cell division protein FtsL
MESVSTIAQLLLGGGGVVILGIIIILAGIKEYWIYGHVHKAMIAMYEKRLAEEQARSTEWRQLYLDAKSVMESSTTVAAHMVERTPTRR